MTLPDGNKLSITAKSRNEDVNIDLSDHLNKDKNLMEKNSGGDKNKVRYENITEYNETSTVKKASLKDGHNSEQSNSTRLDEKPPIPEKKSQKTKRHGTDSKDWEDFQFTGIPPGVQKNDKKIPRRTQSPKKKTQDQLKKPPLPKKTNTKKLNADSVIYEDLAVDGIRPGYQLSGEPIPEHVPEERPEDDYDLIDPSDVLKNLSLVNIF